MLIKNMAIEVKEDKLNVAVIAACL